MIIWISITATLIGALWLANISPPKLWLTYFFGLLLVGLYLSWSQYEAGCRFSLGECYSQTLPEAHFWLKAVFALLSELSWLALGLVLLVRIVIRLKNRTKAEA